MTTTKKVAKTKETKITGKNSVTKKKTTEKKRVKKAPASKRLKKKVTKSKTIQKRVSILPAKKPRTALAVLSPFRFPVSLETLAIRTARIGGMAILIAGGIFTALYSQYIWNFPPGGVPSQQSATAMLACDISGGLTEYRNCILNHNTVTLDTTNLSTASVSSQSTSVSTSDGVVETFATTTAVAAGNATVDAAATAVAITGNEVSVATAGTATEPQPPVTFLVKQSEPLTDVVPIYISVKSAEGVDLSVFKESYTTSIPLGRATQVQNDVWEYQWDTTLFEDGNYKIAADITNTYTLNDPYRNIDGKYLSVQNSPQQDPVLGAPVIDAVILNTQSSISAVTTNGSLDTVAIAVSVTDAQVVTLYATHLSSGSINIIGQAQDRDAGEWKYVWDATEYTPGIYSIQAKITTPQDTYRSDSVTVLVQPPINNLTQDAQDDAVTDVEIPKPVLVISNDRTLSGVIDMQVHIPGAFFVELWVVPEGTKTPQIIGLANKNFGERDNWNFTWNTRGIPNGSFEIYPRVKNTYGIYEGDMQRIKVFNKSFVQELSVEQIQQDTKVTQAEVLTLELDTKLRNEQETFENQEDMSLEEGSDSDIESEQTNTPEVTALTVEFSDKLDTELQRLVTAYRSGDPSVISTSEQRITEFKKQILASVSEENTPEITKEVLARIDAKISEKKERAEKVQKIITERVGAEVFKDSDSDGVTDYDERVLYKTDPYSADTDKDGFNDGIEIAGGYNPLDSTKEATRVFESPKERGIVREDILVVKSITPIIPENPEKDTDGVNAQAVITGRALPNSYVTLYIFSLPTVVTVKTESDGSWQYRFDKELEDGEHEIYVGVTDNAGRIVAKSAAFRFVKEAQAFTPEDASALGAITNRGNDSDSLLSTFMVYLILSISVVSIGLVLILLGLHLDTRRKQVGEVLKADE